MTPNPTCGKCGRVLFHGHACKPAKAQTAIRAANRCTYVECPTPSKCVTYGCTLPADTWSASKYLCDCGSKLEVRVAVIGGHSYPTFDYRCPSCGLEYDKLLNGGFIERSTPRVRHLATERASDTREKSRTRGLR